MAMTPRHGKNSATVMLCPIHGEVQDGVHDPVDARQIERRHARFCGEDLSRVPESELGFKTALDRVSSPFWRKMEATRMLPEGSP